jgi:hypothetical protein
MDIRTVQRTDYAHNVLTKCMIQEEKVDSTTVKSVRESGFVAVKCLHDRTSVNISQLILQYLLLRCVKREY